jgi:hypothetical protein
MAKESSSALLTISGRESLRPAAWVNQWNQFASTAPVHAKIRGVDRDDGVLWI